MPGDAEAAGTARAGRIMSITPRFAITSTPEQMEMTETLAREYPDLHIQTHVGRKPRRGRSSPASFIRTCRTISASTSAITCSGRRRCWATVST